MEEKKLDTREKLWELQTEALNQSKIVENPYWKMAYENLAFSLNTLDAFMARSSDDDIDLLTNHNK